MDLVFFFKCIIIIYSSYVNTKFTIAEIFAFYSLFNYTFIPYKVKTNHFFFFFMIIESQSLILQTEIYHNIMYFSNIHYDYSDN